MFVVRREAVVRESNSCYEFYNLRQTTLFGGEADHIYIYIYNEQMLSITEKCLTNGILYILRAVDTLPSFELCNK